MKFPHSCAYCLVQLYTRKLHWNHHSMTAVEFYIMSSNELLDEVFADLRSWMYYNLLAECFAVAWASS